MNRNYKIHFYLKKTHPEDDSLAMVSIFNSIELLLATGIFDHNLISIHVYLEHYNGDACSKVEFAGF